MRIELDGCEVSEAAQAAISRGLEAVGAPTDMTVVVSTDLAAVVNRLESHHGGTYAVQRGPLGEVAAKTIHEAGTTTIVVGRPMLERPLDDLERLLAHEGCHAVLHAADEHPGPLQLQDSTTGPAMLRFIAELSLTEYRIERRLAELGYEVAEHGDDDTLRLHMFAVPAGILDAAQNPRSEDAGFYARVVLGAIQPLTLSMAYRLGSVTAGGQPPSPDIWPAYARTMWAETAARTWAQRVDLYSGVPAAGGGWGGSAAASHLRRAAELERRLVRDFGFKVTAEATDGGRWSFRRVADYSAFLRWDDLLTAESQRVSDEEALGA